ncbi:MAG: hypothetical protein GX307_02755 [Euryarchaeota archaeon]|nr:hypothetical protein [Euryarchaeota archaeon]
MESIKSIQKWPGVRVPQPERVKVLILSESPSYHILTIYRVSRTFDDATARKMIFAAAEPGRLLVRTDNFLREMGDSQREEKMDYLGKLFRVGHLIYLFKEPVDESIGAERPVPNSVHDEIDALLDEGVHIIVALGETVQSWFEDNFPVEGLTLIRLPVPSNHVSDWFPSFMERMSRERGADTLGVRDAMAVQIDMLVRTISAL